MSKITASVICDSIGQHSPRLTTFLTHYPKFVHPEHCRHRSHSFCVSSSRAIPSKRYLEIVRSDEERAEPAFWGAEQKGMSPGSELDDANCYRPENGGGYYRARTYARQLWTEAAWMASNTAEKMIRIGVHKSIANRLLDPFVPVNVLVTSCEAGFLNFSGLRLDSAADPTIRALAEAMWAAWSESEPRKLEPGNWHLPFMDGDWHGQAPIDASDKMRHEIALKCSTARCARLSYMSYETNKRSTVKEDLALYDRLINAQPIHASPAEHQATPDEWIGKKKLVWRGGGTIGLDELGNPNPVFIDRHRIDGRSGWKWEDAYKNEHLHGNLPGWIQYRKTLPDEAVAPLPTGYTYRQSSV